MQVLIKHKLPKEKLQILLRWCQSKVALVKIGAHLIKTCASFTPVLGSHCSVHNQIETEEMAKEAKYRSLNIKLES